MRSAILAGALLAFALSFDEVIVTIFVAGGVKTLPIWIFQSFRLANQVALVNVAGIVAILLSVIPVYIATRLTSDAGVVGRTKKPPPHSVTPFGDTHSMTEPSLDLSSTSPVAARSLPRTRPPRVVVRGGHGHAHPRATAGG